MPQHKPPRRPGPAAAFSLLELLVVVGIIAILAAILLPVLGGAHEQGRRAHCLANLTQIGKALGIYSNDFSEYLPSHAGWGLSDYTYSVDGGTLTPYFGQQGPSRHMVIGYGGIDANPAVDLALGNINFEPVGLGILAMRNNLTGASLICRFPAGFAEHLLRLRSVPVFHHRPERHRRQRGLQAAGRLRRAQFLPHRLHHRDLSASLPQTLASSRPHAAAARGRGRRRRRAAACASPAHEP